MTGCYGWTQGHRFVNAAKFLFKFNFLQKDGATEIHCLSELLIFVLVVILKKEITLEQFSFGIAHCFKIVLFIFSNGCMIFKINFRSWRT